MTYAPKYNITPKMVTALASIEVSRDAVGGLPITAKMMASLRESARVSSTHHSTAIEGNQLSIHQVHELIKGGGNFPNREKDEFEVLNYSKALDYIDHYLKEDSVLGEEVVRKLHGISFFGKEKATPYRDGQNVIRAGKLVVYIPPKAEDVSILMQDLLIWINNSVHEKLPIPIIAGLAHYQFATIHPYYDGNGRTARLFATLILHKYGYSLKGIYSLEEYYARDLEAYYQSLTIGYDEDYYDGNRAKSDVTKFLEYFVEGMDQSFMKVKKQALTAQIKGNLDQSVALRELTNQQKQILNLFIKTKEITVKDIANFFNVSERQARYLCHNYVSDGFLQISNFPPKTRRYVLSDRYELLVQDYIKTLA